MIVIVFKYLTRFGIQGLTLFPFVLIGDKNRKSDLILLNHERIHLRQQIDLLVLPFYIWYVSELLVRRFQFGSWYLAYRNISFEREAYENEKNFNYLNSRSFGCFWNYIGTND